MISISAPDPVDHAGWMARGIELHAAAQLEQALIAFEQAGALATGDVNTTIAIATLLSELSRPKAAYRLLLSIEAQLLDSADGAANLAIAAEACGDGEKAAATYQLALELDPHHLRALNNLALMEAAQGQWGIAIDRARKCIELAPNEPSYHQHLADFLAGARRFAESLEVLAAAARRFPHHVDITVRRITVLAFNGQLEASHALQAALDVTQRTYLQQFLARAAAETDTRQCLVPFSAITSDAFQLYTRQAFEAMSICDWRDQDKLTHALRQVITESRQTDKSRDFRDAQFYGSLLDLREDEMAKMREISTSAIAEQVAPGLPRFSARETCKRLDGRIHVGLAIKSVSHDATLRALQQQLLLHDRERFAIHLYSSTQRPSLQHKDSLGTLSESMVETAHMSHAEAAARIRLDRLDLFVDMAFNSPWCRPEIPALRVAPVQICQLTWHRHHPPQPCDYNISDTFVHPEGINLKPYGPVVRLPHTCWLATPPVPCEPQARSQMAAVVPDDTFVLCSVIPSVTLDPSTFNLWMSILRSLPQAVLWLPGFSAAAASNLSREAEAVGVSPSRIRFFATTGEAEWSANLRNADLFLDPIRFNANHGLVNALQLGVPAITCAGNSMASRLGGSIVRSAGLPACIFENEKAYVQAAISLGQNPDRLNGLRATLKEAHPTAPLFDLQARVRELEAAWTFMVERGRAGLPPVAFDVPPHQRALPGNA